MLRRKFIALSAGAVLFSSGIYTAYFKPLKLAGQVFSFAQLPPDLQNLYSKDFDDALPNSTTQSLLKMLSDKGVLYNGQWKISQVARSAATDLIITHQNAAYSETELALYTFVARLRSRSIYRFFSPNFVA